MGTLNCAKRLFFVRFLAMLGFVALFRIAFRGLDRTTTPEKACNGADRNIFVVRSFSSVHLLECV